MTLIQMKRQAFLVLGVFMLLAACTSTKPAEMPTLPDTVVYVVRHAEKADASPDTPLSAAGMARAEALAEKLINEPITRIYATTLQRTQQTLAVLAKAKGIAIIPLDPNNTDELVQRIKTDDLGQVILVAGHSNTIPGIIQALNGTVIEPIEEHQFDRVYKVALSANGTSRVEVMHFGVGTP